MLEKNTYLIRQDNTIYKHFIKLFFLSVGQDTSKLQKQISKLHILNEMAAWPPPPQKKLNKHIRFLNG